MNTKTKPTVRAILGTAPKWQGASQPYETETIQHAGRSFIVALYPDDFEDTPNEREDGHGGVRQISDSESMARGEVFLAYGSNRGYRWVYDFGAALVQASREKWGLSSDDLAKLTRILGKSPTRGQINAASVRADMKYLSGFYSSDWCYVGVCVRIVGADGEPEGDEFENAIWGVESCGNYWSEVAKGIAGDILSSRSKAWRAALTERRRVRYWASRDVVTVMGA